MRFEKAAWVKALKNETGLPDVFIVAEKLKGDYSWKQHKLLWISWIIYFTFKGGFQNNRNGNVGVSENDSMLLWLTVGPRSLSTENIGAVLIALRKWLVTPGFLAGHKLRTPDCQSSCVVHEVSSTKGHNKDVVFFLFFFDETGVTMSSHRPI